MTTLTISTLAHLEVNASGLIVGFASQSSKIIRLQELGFLPGSEVQIISRSSFDGPITFEVKGSRIALRKEDASEIVVSPLHSN